jgi:ABC-2 type transport system ATP-binding protein
MIKVEHLTKDYGNGKGVFDVSLHIHQGEVYGYLGPNGAGKSTTLRHIMGFSNADSGTISINGLNAWTDQEKIKESIGYLPGEIALPGDMTGLEYLKLIAKMRRMDSFAYAEELLNYFEINPNISIKRMSKGMKQKIAIVATFMHNPDIVLLDEPTSGLDPLMQEKFIKLVEQEKNNGKTILMSSHIFEEVSKVCDRVGILKQGRLMNEMKVDELKHSKTKTYQVAFNNISDFHRMKSIYPDAKCFEYESRCFLQSKTKMSINSFTICRIVTFYT